MIAVQRGAALVRVHDVAVTRDALAVWAGVAAGDRPRTARSAAARPPRTPWDED